MRESRLTQVGKDQNSKLWLLHSLVHNFLFGMLEYQKLIK